MAKCTGEKLNEKKLIAKAKECLSDLGDTMLAGFMTGTEITTQELILKNGRRAQVKIVIQCDVDEFEEVCPD